MYAEDPTTPGEREFSGQEYSGVGSAIIALHYGRLVEKLGQPILAASLTEGFLVPDEIRLPVVVWECLIPPLKGKRFIGGYHIPPNTAQTVKWEKNYSFYLFGDPFNLSRPFLTFFGLEESIFKKIVEIARIGWESARAVSIMELREPLYSAMSLLRDGSTLAPLDFFRPVEQVSF